jgi:CheY-like chemotaxis protein
VILVVEDEGTVRDVACRMLKAIGHETRWAGTGGDALEEIAKGGLDAVLLDMTLPDGRSYDVIDAAAGKLEVVVMSGHAKDELDIGDLPYLAKPFTLADLSRVLPCAS